MPVDLDEIAENEVAREVAVGPVLVVAAFDTYEPAVDGFHGAGAAVVVVAVASWESLVVEKEEDVLVAMRGIVATAEASWADCTEKHALGALSKARAYEQVLGGLNLTVMAMVEPSIALPKRCCYWTARADSNEAGGGGANFPVSVVVQAEMAALTSLPAQQPPAVGHKAEVAAVVL